ncbi:MAG TPA: hypothetical protein VKB75_10295 [Jatrophihabitans sp.]|nr:hypothetical protein [Jatrophihabitans sp.]
MPSIKTALSIKNATKVLGVATLTGLAVGLAAPAAHASPIPPKASSVLFGTWVNTNAGSNSVKQVVVSPARIGNVTVDAFGACVPTYCEWGKVPAIVYGANVSSTTGAIFQTNQRFLSGGKEWSRTALLGQVVKTSVGLRLHLRELTVFEDGSGRKNYEVDETFKLGKGQAPATAGSSVGTYPLGNRPALNAGALGNWVNASPTGGLAKLTIGGPAASPTVHAFGQCSPTACDWGTVRTITYGTSISSTVGSKLLAPYRFSFKKTQLAITYHRSPKGVQTLTVTSYNEFTDGSGRSNYAKTDTLVRP